MSFRNRKAGPKLQRTLQVLRDGFETFAPDEIFVSFNGGKDCTVLLDIIQHCELSDPGRISAHYGITIATVDSDGGMRLALEQICNEAEGKIKACIMGSRRTDPYCDQLKPFQETDEGWPKLTRINPLLEWNCCDIWEYLKGYGVPYCALYDRGYTSIGDRSNTIPNPHLKVEDVTGQITYRPAYCLEDAENLERAGRL